MFWANLILASHETQIHLLHSDMKADMKRTLMVKDRII